jgi:invasion protein IalB
MNFKGLSLSAAVALLVTPAVAQEPLLPGGASSLTETYQDWTVTCQISDGAKICAMSQQQTRQDGQRILTMELRNSDDGVASGVLLLPFGLALDAGVKLQVKDGPSLPPLPFSTCLPVGCVVPLKLDADTIAAFRGGTSLSIAARAHDSNQEVALSLSLSGFTAALDRLHSLGRN